MIPAPDLLARGTRLEGRFEIEERLGQGSFGAVYRAKQLVFGKPIRDVALKLFHAAAVRPDNIEEIFSDAVTLIRLQEEERTAEVADSMIQVYDIGVLNTPQPRAFMSMKLVPGRKTLKNEIARSRHGGMPVEAAVSYLRKLLVPVAWMHTHGLVHGDLKPDNVLLTEQFAIVLTDFGLAARLPLGTVGGEIHYQAQEVLLHLPGQAPNDVFSAGLIFYEMLTGKHPFEHVDAEALAAGANSEAIVQAQAQARKWEIRPPRNGRPESDIERIVPPAEINAEMRDHPQLELLLASCLAYRESDRPANARVLLEKIDKYVQSGTITGLTRPAPPPPKGDKWDAATKTPEALLSNAKVLLANGDHAGALQRVEAARSARPVNALLLKAAILIDSKRTDDAELAIQQASKIASGDPRILEAKANLFQAKGDTETAKTLLKRAQEMKNQKR